MKLHIKGKVPRLFFVDAIRAWAILMMLQGHFMDGLLAPVFRDTQNVVFKVWLYFRGVTAPVFFTVSGFIFTYLLVQASGVGWDNPRLKKGIRRGLQLLGIGYLLRLNIFGLFQGELYETFYQIDVLHCIGLSLLCLAGLYGVAARKQPHVFPLLLAGTTCVLFLLEPVYTSFSYDFLPASLAHYFTKSGGSVFTIFPWLGYATAGGALAVLFIKFRNALHFYPYAIGIAVLLGYGLVFYTPAFFAELYKLTGIALFQTVQEKDYLFARLGDVFWVFALFMALRHFFAHRAIVQVGASTLTIYVVHYMVLYGSLTGLGLYRWFHHSLSPAVAMLGALGFIVVCTGLSLYYTKHETTIKKQLVQTFQAAREGGSARYNALFLEGKRLAFRVGMLAQRWFLRVRG